MTNTKQKYMPQTISHNCSKKKSLFINFIITLCVIALIFSAIYFVYRPYKLINTVKDTPLYRIGNETISNLISTSFEDENWSVAYYSDSISIITIEGFMTSLNENIKVELSYAVDDDITLLHIQNIIFLDSNKVYTLLDNHTEVLNFISILYENVK